MIQYFIAREESYITIPNYFVSTNHPTEADVTQLRHAQRVLEAQFLGGASVMLLPEQNLEFQGIYTSDGVSLLEPTNWEKEINIEINTFLINDNFLNASGCETIFDFIEWVSLENLIDLFQKKIFLLAMVNNRSACGDAGGDKTCGSK